MTRFVYPKYSVCHDSNLRQNQERERKGGTNQALVTLFIYAEGNKMQSWS